MRVVLSTIGKFHSFDLARQMHKRGALTTIYSGYPRFKLKREKLPRKNLKTFPYLHAPYMRLAPRGDSARKLWEWQDRVWFDRYVASQLPECDVFCGLSGSGLFTSKVAKSQGAKYVCDRGSSHIRIQDRILREEYKRQGMQFAGIDPRIIAREEAEYDAADVITVPSTFALNTFIECGVEQKKLRLVPYGVDLRSFYPCGQKNEDSFDVLFVGGVCVRKGVRYLLEAFDQVQHQNKHLRFVGTVSPELEDTVARLRDNPQITFMGHVPQDRLKVIMSTSHVMVLPSVEEGLACVQAQAMACGCAIVATNNTGAHDLFTNGREGFIVPIRDSSVIADRLQRLADNPGLRAAMSAAAIDRVRSIGGWDQYGARMYQMFSELVG